MDMSQRHSPAVIYPLRHSELLRILWAAVVTCSALVLLFWSWQGAGFGHELWLRVGVSALLWLLCAWLGWQVQQRFPQGALHWTGGCWQWEVNGQVRPLPGVPVVILDLQRLLVVGFVDEHKRTQHFVLQRNWAPHAWMDLRRAVYSSANPLPDISSSKAL